MKWLYPLVLLLLLSACSNIKTPIKEEESILPADKALLELNISVADDISTTALPKEHEFVAPEISIVGASELIAFKDGTNPIVINVGDIGEYINEYRLEPMQTLNAFGNFEQGHLNLLLASKLWQFSRGKGVTIAVIDSGIDKNHKSLRGAYFTGYNFIDKTTLQNDESGHGTAISALIAGRGPQIGIVSEAKILPLKVLDEHNQGSNYDVTRAILFAADLLEGMPNPKPADIINLSLGSYSYSAVMHDAIKRAHAKGIIIIAAAGNSGKDKIAYPAALPEVISVGAAQLINQEWSLMPYSNYGKYADILAPMGGLAKPNWGHYAELGLLTAKANQTTAGTRVHGTSFAAAEVTAVAALLVALGLDSKKLKEVLLGSAIDIGTTGWDDKFAYGILSPLAALKSARAEANSKKIIVQLLDAASQQEITRITTNASANIKLDPGRYKIFAFEDNNHDNLWQYSEAFFHSESFDFKAKQLYQKELVLNFN